MRLIRGLLIASAFAPLGGCSGESNTASPGSVSTSEAQALDDAAAMLDERPSDDAEPSSVPATQAAS